MRLWRTSGAELPSSRNSTRLVGRAWAERTKEGTHARTARRHGARRLFIERGFEQVSVAEIARAAEVSQATVFNYFPNKEDLVYNRLEAFEEQLLAAIHDRAPGETILAAFRRFILEPRGLLAATDEAKKLVALTRMIEASPALLAREQQVFARYANSLADLIAQETGASAGDAGPYVVANALIGVHRALIAHVRRRLAAGTPNRARLACETRERGEKALALLAEGLGDYAAAGTHRGQRHRRVRGERDEALGRRHRGVPSNR